MAEVVMNDAPDIASWEERPSSAADTAEQFSIFPPQRARKKMVRFNLSPSLCKKRQRSNRSLNGNKSSDDEESQLRWEPFLQYDSMTSCMQKTKKQPQMPIRRKSADKPAQIVLPARRSSLWAARNRRAQVFHNSSDQPLNIPMRKSSLLSNTSPLDDDSKDIFPRNIQQIITELKLLDMDASSSEFDSPDAQLELPVHGVSVDHKNVKDNKPLCMPIQKSKTMKTNSCSGSRKKEMDIQTAIDRVQFDKKSLEMVDSSRDSEGSTDASTL